MGCTGYKLKEVIIVRQKHEAVRRRVGEKVFIGGPRQPFPLYGRYGHPPPCESTDNALRDVLISEQREQGSTTGLPLGQPAASKASVRACTSALIS